MRCFGLKTAVFTWYSLLSSWGFQNVWADAQKYHLSESYTGYNFFDEWTWETFQDPTHGRVNYVDIETAIARNLSFATHEKFVMRADHWNHVAPFSRGRDSVRVKSKASYSNALFVLDLQHMPEGCATWPAWWTLSRNGPWPQGGEIDILEGVNLNDRNAVTLHTSGGCKMPQWRNQAGTTTSFDCDVSVNSNQGCGTTFAKSNSYGTNFNQRGGGWYAVERSDQAINVWFWSRDDDLVPPALRWWSGGDIDLNGWGIPEASFTFELCPYMEHFDEHQVIFDLTFCGDWAGSTFSAAGCGSMSCDEFVNQNPGAFENAYWEINSFRVYAPFKDFILEPLIIPQGHGGNSWNQRHGH